MKRSFLRWLYWLTTIAMVYMMIMAFVYEYRL